MTRPCVLASAAVTLLLPVLTGCAIMHKSAPPPVALVTPAPDPAPVPLYNASLAQGEALLPALPDIARPDIQPAPPAVSEVAERHPLRVAANRRRRRGEIELAERETHERETRDREAAASEASEATQANNEAPPTTVTAPATTTDAAAQTTSIGQLVAGPSQDTAGSRQQAADLIQSTQHGVDGLRRSLSEDQTKTVAQIKSFLAQAERAMHNNDIDGAYTLATKAKTLLNELTGAS